MNKIFIPAVALAAMFMIGCSNSSIDVPPENVQMRMDYMSFLREMNNRQQVQGGYVREISGAAGELTDNDTDKEKLVSLSKELLKAKGEEVSRLCVEMGKLIPLGEGYEDYYPSAKNSGGSVGVDDTQ
jgi:hypothetical protein